MKQLIKKIFKRGNPIEDFNEGYFRCMNCNAKIPFNYEDALMVSSCNSCDCPALIPARVSDYLLYLPLGAGGMGSVYKAISFSGRSEYAIKIIPRERLGDKVCEQNIMSEGQIGETLGTHPNIIAALDYGIVEGEHFLATAFCEGERLDNLIDLEGPVSEKRGLEIVLALTDALIHIIDKGYLYRDMKPENIIIDRKGTVKLFDFGLCMLKDIAAEPDDEDDNFAGSALFVPPERIVGEAEAEYSEVYTLGLLLFYILTGKNYYNADEMMDLVEKHVTALRVSSTRFRLKHCNDHTIATLDKMIVRNPFKRYQSMADAQQDLLVALKNVR